MAKIQANQSGTRNIEVSETHLETIKKYQLLRGLADSTGFVDEQTLEKLRLNVRALLGAGAETDKDLLDLCLDVVYHPNMKVFGLKRLIALYSEWAGEEQ